MQTQKQSSKMMTTQFTPQKTYQIQFQSSQNDYGQNQWFLSIDKQRKNRIKQRSANTNWIYLQKATSNLMKVNIKWKIIPTEVNDVYLIKVAEEQFQNNQIYCYQDMKQDIRDNVSFYVFSAAQFYNNGKNKWIIKKIANSLYSIQHEQNGRYLSAHRYSDKDKINNQSTLMMAHDKNYFILFQAIHYVFFHIIQNKNIKNSQK